MRRKNHAFIKGPFIYRNSCVLFVEKICRLTKGNELTCVCYCQLYADTSNKKKTNFIATEINKKKKKKHRNGSLLSAFYVTISCVMLDVVEMRTTELKKLQSICF